MATIFDMREPRPMFSRLKHIADVEPDEPPEKEVAAEPKLGRSVVSYLEAREGIDGKSYFNQCASCASFVPEAQMRGLVRGDRCCKFGSDFPVTDDSGCNLYTPNPDGTPCAHCQDHAAEKMIKGMRPSVSPWEVNYVRDKKRHCENCRHYEYDEKPTCALMEEMNEKLPAVFEMNAEIKPVAKCDLWTDYPVQEIL